MNDDIKLLRYTREHPRTSAILSKIIFMLNQQFYRKIPNYVKQSS